MATGSPFGRIILIPAAEPFGRETCFSRMTSEVPGPFVSAKRLLIVSGAITERTTILARMRINE